MLKCFLTKMVPPCAWCYLTSAERPHLLDLQPERTCDGKKRADGDWERQASPSVILLWRSSGRFDMLCEISPLSECHLRLDFFFVVHECFPTCMSVYPSMCVVPLETRRGAGCPETGYRQLQAAVGMLGTEPVSSWRAGTFLNLWLFSLAPDNLIFICPLC